MPRVDVLIPAYNAAAYLEASLRSIIDQTFTDLGIVVVDDGSTDATGAILARFAATDPRIVVVTQPNAGIVAAIAAGLQHCRSPLLARHDADDLAAPDRIERQVRHLADHPECVAVAGQGRHIDEHGRFLGTLTRRKDPARADPFNVPAREPYLMQPFLMVRREAFDKVGGFRPINVAEDSDLYWRLWRIGRLDSLADIMGDYRMHAASVSSASIAHGRRLATAACIAALSAQRREEGVQDLLLPPDLSESLRTVGELDDLSRLIAGQLTEGEQRWLDIALSAKLLELCFYRPFELAASDIRFMRGAFRRGWDLLSTGNARELREFIIATATRLITKRHFSRGLTLVSPREYPVVGLRVLFRVGFPGWLRDAVKRRVGRSQTA